MATSVKRERLRFTDGLIDYLQEVDYRLAVNDQDREDIFKFRYQSFLRDNAVTSADVDNLTDDYDKMSNCWLFGIHYQQKLASSMRVHVVTPENPTSPSFDVFPDIIRPMIDKGYRIVDPSKFVSDSAATNHFPVLPFLTFRLACMAATHFNADYCLLSIGAVHAQFYERIFGMKQIGGPRPYPQLTTQAHLMCANVAELWDGLIEKYPVFRSTFTERRMLFERPLDLPVSGNDGTQDKVVKLSKTQLN
ncbi:MAG: hypothetical protein L3J32_02475 [Rhizobiaceae bacterium]|nr:hypothetical protein [Rhizobiaceae bacterium]